MSTFPMASLFDGEIFCACFQPRMGSSGGRLKFEILTSRDVLLGVCEMDFRSATASCS